MKVWLTVMAVMGLAGGIVRAELIVHEWGTFTSLQGEDGRAIGGINTDDEPVPDFVHNLSGQLLIPPTEAPPSFFQGAPSCHSDVTMRLETPVIYFHPSPDFSGKVTVQAKFVGGWLTQFYPDAQAVAPGISKNGVFGRLRPDTVSSLKWKDVTLGANQAAFPKTEEHVWLAPRGVEAAAVSTPAGESERYLFYRGVANRDAPVRLVRTGNSLHVKDQEVERIDRFWLVNIRRDGELAFRSFEGDEAVTADFADADFGGERKDELRDALLENLMGAGLFEDEAQALLDTWRLSYFQSPGLRVFFLVPRVWTDRVLPLTVSGDATVTRVMVGRIELVTPEQRRLLRKLSDQPAPRSWEDLRQPLEKATLQAGKIEEWNRLMRGTLGFDDLGLALPEAYRAYLDLGRFRNALVLEEQRRHPSEKLAAFIGQFGLAGYDP